MKKRIYTFQSFPFHFAGLPLNPQMVWKSLCILGIAQFYAIAVFAQDYPIHKNAGSDALSAVGTICFKTEGGMPITDIMAQVSGSGNNIPSFVFTTITGGNGCIDISSLPLASNAIVTPLKDDNPLNGVSTYDLVLISKHILGIQALTSPFKIIAADANKSNSITTFDIVEIRKLILGIYTQLPNNTSWRFVSYFYTFPNPLNPFSATFPEFITIFQVPTTPSTAFTAIKVGDVNGNAGVNSPEATDARSAQFLSIADRVLQAGEVLEVPVFAGDAVQWLGFQLGLQYDEQRLAIEAIQSGNLPAMDADNFAQAPGLVRCSWSQAHTHGMDPRTPLFTLRVRALETIRLSEALQLEGNTFTSEAYDDQENARLPLNLEFRAETSKNTGDATVTLVRPNPTHADAILSLQLTESEQVQCTLYDAAGRLCYQTAQWMEAGQNSLELPAAAMPSAGVYTWKIVTAQMQQTGKLVKQ